MSVVVDPSMEDLPDNVMVDILSRLPVKKIIHCKCVCKKWLNIVLEPYFANLHRLRSPAGFMIYRNSEDEEEAEEEEEEEEEEESCYEACILKWVEVEDELDHHNLHHDPVMSLDLDLSPILRGFLIFPVGSVNGLVCLSQIGHSTDDTCICNPITREYMILRRQQYYCIQDSIISFSFGVSSLTQEYKVIRIVQTHTPPDSISTFRECLSLSQAEVYILGTVQWRTLGHVPYWLDEPAGRFLNGHAHFTFGDQDSREKICSFNFYNETFELFPSPPCEATAEDRQMYCFRLGVLKGCLCRCDTYYSKLTVWVMKEYGIENSWHKELVIQLSIRPNVDMMALQPAFPVEGFKDGTILMETFGNNLIVYCPRRKAITETEIFEGRFRYGLAYRPSFHRLQSFENESVHVF